MGEERNPFPKRITEEVVVELSELESDVMNKVGLLGEHIIHVADSQSSHNRRLARWSVTHLYKRSLSSPRALLKSLDSRKKRISKTLEEEGTLDESAVKEEEAKAIVLDNDPGERTSEEVAGNRLEKLVFGERSSLLREKDLIDEVITVLKNITSSRDSKLSYMLNNTLNSLIRNKNKAIVFTKYKDTLDYLAEQIPQHRNFRGITIVTLYGELNETQRKERFKEFERAKRAVMVATDAISEGLNLQYISSQIIHYELPWNPNRLEQRNGRIDRYGQREMEVKIRTMVANHPLEAAILNIIVKKAENIRRDHGFSPPFFGDEISIIDLIREQGIDVSIGQTKLDTFNGGFKPAKAIKDPFSHELVQKMKEENFYGQSSIDLSEIKKRLKDTENLVGNKDEFKEFIESSFRKFGCKKTNNFDGTFRLEINHIRLTENNTNNVIERCTFDHMRGRDLGHPIVQTMISMVKESTFKTNGDYGRTACLCVETIEKVIAVYTFLTRYTVGTKPLSIIEELLSIASEVYSDIVYYDDTIVDTLWHSSPHHLNRSLEEMKSDLKEALLKNFDRFMREKAQQRCNKLILERRNIKDKFVEGNASEWVEGFDNLSVASVDLLCVTIYYPVR